VTYAPPVYYAPQPYYRPRSVYVPAPAPYYAVGTVLASLPPGAVMQLINGYTWATLGGLWFFWDGNRGAWVVANTP
jgi:hypothetical protein